LKPSDELLLEVREDTIILKPLLGPVKVRANREWAKRHYFHVLIFKIPYEVD